MRLQLSLLLIAASLQVGATDCGQVIRDPGFDLWCGDQLCTWKVVRGEVARVGTWHEGDAGIALLGPDTAIAQLAPVNSGDGTCLRFDLVANVEDSAEVFLDVDVEGDGTPEMHQRLPTSHWKPLSFTFQVAAPYDAIRFALTKAGAGEAVVAQIAAETRPAADCEGMTALDPGPRRNGARCADGGDCASGICDTSPTGIPDAAFFVRACLGCDGAHPCGPGEVCGVGPAGSPMLAVPVTCVAEGASEVGEACLDDAQCASGTCFHTLQSAEGVCSECTSSATCTGAEICNAAWAGPSGPYVCGAGQHLGAAGEVCATDDDCASSRCDGTARKECRDGRPCDSPGDCPVEDGLAPGACTPVGIQGGRCE